MDAALKAVIDERREVLDRLRRLLIDELGVDREPAELDADAPLFFAGLGLDSLDAVELVYLVQEAFELPRMPDLDSDVSTMRTLNSLADELIAWRRRSA